MMDWRNSGVARWRKARTVEAPSFSSLRIDTSPERRVEFGNRALVAAIDNAEAPPLTLFPDGKSARCIIDDIRRHGRVRAIVEP